LKYRERAAMKTYQILTECFCAPLERRLRNIENVIAEKSNRNKKIHVFSCKNCGYTSNDDRIGAMNLYRKGIEYLNASVPDTVA